MNRKQFITALSRQLSQLSTEERNEIISFYEDRFNNAIYEGGVEWSWAGGTDLSGSVTLQDGSNVDADEIQEPVSDEFYYIVPGKCTECNGFHEEPQCGE